jgi:hypothetical protein
MRASLFCHPEATGLLILHPTKFSTAPASYPCYHREVPIRPGSPAMGLRFSAVRNLTPESSIEVEKVVHFLTHDAEDSYDILMILRKILKILLFLITMKILDRRSG